MPPPPPRGASGDFENKLGIACMKSFGLGSGSELFVKCWWWLKLFERVSGLIVMWGLGDQRVLGRARSAFRDDFLIFTDISRSFARFGFRN